MAGESVLMTNLKNNLYECLGPTWISLLCSSPSVSPLRCLVETPWKVLKHKLHLHRLPSRDISAPSQVPVLALSPDADSHGAIKWGETCVTSQVSCVCLHCSQKHCCSISHRGGADTLAGWQVSRACDTQTHTTHFCHSKPRPFPSWVGK